MKDNGKQDERWIQGSTDFAAQLSTYQCQMAMQAFSHPGDVSEEEIAAIWPAQLLILRAVLMGCYEVFDYLEAVSRDSEDENNEMMKEYARQEGPNIFEAMERRGSGTSLKRIKTVMYSLDPRDVVTVLSML